jgi:hypothetical protein
MHTSILNATRETPAAYVYNPTQYWRNVETVTQDIRLIKIYWKGP